MKITQNYLNLILDLQCSDSSVFMKIKCQIFIIFLLILQIIGGGCSTSDANGQTGQEKNSQNTNAANNSSFGNKNNLANTVSATPKLKETVILPAKLKKQNLNQTEMSEISKVLGWRDSEDFCGSQNSAKSTERKLIRVRFYDLEKDFYLLQLDCGEANNLFYLYSEKNNSPTAQTMVFEYFEKDIETGKFTKFITYFPNGKPEFNSKNRKMSVTANFVSSANCGYISTYIFQNGKSILDEVRANWNCENNYPANKNWQKEDINKMRNLTSETIDEATQTDELKK